LAKWRVLIVPSGLLLFITNATSLATDPTFQLKLLLLIVAMLNALVYHRFISRRYARLGQSRGHVAQGVTAVISIVIWMAIIACGRLLAY
jgi:hypothetical protein